MSPGQKNPSGDSHKTIRNFGHFAYFTRYEFTKFTSLPVNYTQNAQLRSNLFDNESRGQELQTLENL